MGICITRKGEGAGASLHRYCNTYIAVRESLAAEPVIHGEILYPESHGWGCIRTMHHHMENDSYGFGSSLGKRSVSSTYLLRRLPSQEHICGASPYLTIPTFRAKLSESLNTVHRKVDGSVGLPPELVVSEQIPIAQDLVEAL